MKVAGVDIGKKYIIAEVDGKQVIISFDYSIVKGIHNVSFRNLDNVKVTSTYPGLFRVIREVWMLTTLNAYKVVKRVTQSGGRSPDKTF